MIHQPVKLSKMIRYRIESHARRNDRHQMYLRTIADIRCDCNIEAEAIKSLPPSKCGETIFAGYYDEWSMFFVMSRRLIDVLANQRNHIKSN